MRLWSVVRWMRAAGFAAACVALAAAAHAAGGGMVHRLPVLLGFALVFVPALALTGRERTIREIVPAVAVSQVVLHTLLEQMCPMHETVQSTVGAAHGAHGGGSPGLGMLLMHSVAVLLVSWWLECGEAGLCGLVRRIAAWVLRPLTLLLSAPTPCLWRELPIVWGRHPLPYGVLRHVMVTRGPPPAAAALI